MHSTLLSQHRCWELSSLCIPKSDAWDLLRAEMWWMNNDWLTGGSDQTRQSGEGRRGQMVTEIVCPQRVTTPPVSQSAWNLCQFVLMLSKSTVALFLTEYIWSAIVSPVNSSQQATSSQLSSSRKFLPIIARSGDSEEQELDINLVGIP